MAQLVSALPCSLERMSVGTFFEFINQFTVMKFQLIAVEYTGLKFTKGIFNPKPKALEEGEWTPKLIFANFVKHSQVQNHLITKIGQKTPVLSEIRH